MTRSPDIRLPNLVVLKMRFLIGYGPMILVFLYSWKCRDACSRLGGLVLEAGEVWSG